MRKILAIRRQKRGDALFAIGFTEKSANGRRSFCHLQKRNFTLCLIGNDKGFRNFESETKMSEGWAVDVTVRFSPKTGLS